MGIYLEDENVLDQFGWLTVSGVIRIESVNFFDHGDYTQVEATCLAHDFCRNVFEIGMNLSFHDQEELLELKESLRPGDFYFVKDEVVSWENGYMRLFEPDLSPFDGDIAEINECFDANPPDSKTVPDTSWANDISPHPIVGLITDFRLIEMGNGGSTAILDIETKIGFVRGILPPIAYERYGQLLNKGECLIIFGSLQPAIESEDNIAKIVVDTLSQP